MDGWKQGCLYSIPAVVQTLVGGLYTLCNYSSTLSVSHRQTHGAAGMHHYPYLRLFAFSLILLGVGYYTLGPAAAVEGLFPHSDDGEMTQEEKRWQLGVQIASLTLFGLGVALVRF